MKTLLLLRHGKSSWKDVSLDDHDRPLKKRGRRDAPRMGRLLAAQELVPEVILSSTARRARQTARRAVEACGFDGELLFDEKLYMTGPERMLRRVERLAPGADRVMLVGHNPGLEDLLHYLTGEDQFVPTAALAWIELEIDDWSRAGPRSGRLIELWRPRELPPEYD